MRLLLVELTRFRSRRAIALILVGATLLTALIAVTMIWETRPVSEADRAAAQAQADREAQQPHVQRELARCERRPERYLGPGADPARCAEVIVPRPEWFLQRSELDLSRVNRDAGLGVLVIAAAFMIIAGTTFAGADWASGSMSNQLLFEPRRSRVWLAKAGAVLLGTLAATALIVAAFWVALYLVAEARGIPTGATVQEAIRWTAGRGAVLAAAGAVGGYALTMLLRHTVGTLAVMFAYAVGGEIVIASLPVEGVGRWSLANNVFAWLRDGHQYYDPSIPCLPGRDHCDQMASLALGDSAVYLGGLLLAVGVLSLLLFRRRDVP
jgi:ABC-2 type transport system permease protein